MNSYDFFYENLPVVNGYRKFKVTLVHFVSPNYEM